ncbi:PAAR domain-containing protein [Enterobacter cloacae subsp. dissolvens]
MQGFWIIKGDKTSCGGTVLEGTNKKRLGGHNIALNGHKVSCGQHSGTYVIAGGHPGEYIQGVAVASTL